MTLDSIRLCTDTGYPVRLCPKHVACENNDLFLSVTALQEGIVTVPPRAQNTPDSSLPAFEVSP